MNRQQYEHLMSSPWVTPEQRQLYEQLYLQQGQPMEAKTPYGSVIINPRDPRQQQQFHDIHQFEYDVGGVKGKIPSVYYPGPGGMPEQRLLPVVPAPGTTAPTRVPAATAAPAPAPATPAPPATAAATPGNLNDAADAFKYAAEEPGNKGGLPDIISKGPEAAGALGTAPPPIDTKLAQAGGYDRPGSLPALLPPVVRELSDYALERKKAEELNKKDADTFAKNNDSFVKVGVDAARLLPDIAMARNVVEDPNFYSGPGATFVKDIKAIQSKIGGDPNKAASMELFQKILSGSTLKSLRETLQGLGQVRLAEIDLLAKSLPNLTNTQASNRAVLDLLDRTLKQTSYLSARAQEYRNGYRLDDKGNWQQTGGSPSNAEFFQTMQKFAEKTALPKDKIEYYDKMFEPKKTPQSQRTQGGRPAPAPAPVPTSAPPLPPGNWGPG